MNKSDARLIIIVIILALIIGLTFYFTRAKGNKIAKAYYDGKEVLMIDLSNNETNEYHIEGYNGTILIKVENGKIKVEEENSPLHLCSKQGWINEAYETIICLPNKVVIKIESKDSLDAIVR